MISCVAGIDVIILPTHTWSQRQMLRAIGTYRRAFAGRPSPCRFFPTCSSYAHEAIHVHGPVRGGYLAVRRLLRCRPFGPSGFDPVPLPPAQAVSPPGAEKGC